MTRRMEKVVPLLTLVMWQSYSYFDIGACLMTLLSIPAHIFLLQQSALFFTPNYAIARSKLSTTVN